MYLRSVIWLAVQMVVGSYANVLKWSHDYKVFFASWPTRGDDWRVIEAWSAEGYGWGIPGCRVCLNNLDSWRTSCGTVAFMVLGKFSDICRHIGLRISPYQKFATLRPRFCRTFQQQFSQQNALWEWSHVDISLRYIFIYRFPYLLMHYYSFLAQYHNKCLDINWSRLLRSAILSL